MVLLAEKILVAELSTPAQDGFEAWLRQLSMLGERMIMHSDDQL